MDKSSLIFEPMITSTPTKISDKSGEEITLGRVIGGVLALGAGTIRYLKDIPKVENLQWKDLNVLKAGA